MRGRAALLVAGLALGAAAYGLRGEPPPDALPLLSAWTEQFPDTRPASAAEVERHARDRAREGHADAVLLIFGLAAGCLALAAVGDRVRGDGLGRVGVVLVAGSAAVGVAGLVDSVRDQSSRAAREAWTLGDDNLRAVAGPYTERLREWREKVGPHDALVVVGAQDSLLNAVAWALHPRPIYPVGVPIPPSMTADEVRAAVAGTDLGTDAPARWLIDLDALVLRDVATRPALVRVEP